MSRTLVAQDTQIRASRLFSDALAAGATLESGAANLEDDLNALRSQLKRATGEANWYAALSGRAINALDVDLLDMEEKRILSGVEQLTDVTVPAAAYATGSFTAVIAANIIDGTDTFTVDDLINPTVTFEFDTNASVVETATLRQVDISAATTAIEVATAMVSAINGAPNLNWTADNASGTSATVTLTHDLGGTHGNGSLFAESVHDGGFTLVQPTGGAGDVVVLSVAGTEAPSQTAAVGAGTALGAVVSSLTGDVGAHSVVEVSSTNPTAPKNRVLVREAELREGLTVSAGPYAGRQIYGLIQAEAGVVDGDTFNDTDKQVQISFVMIVDDDLVPAPAADIGGKTIEYVYPNRISLDTIPEDCGFPGMVFTDSSGISEAQHKALRQLAHFIEEGPGDGFPSGAYKETTPAGPFPTLETWWGSPAKLKRLVEVETAWSGVFPSSEIWRLYGTDGVTVLVTLVDTITYSGAFEVSRTRTWS